MKQASKVFLGTPGDARNNSALVLHDFKRFLWRHPEIHGLTRTETLMSDIRHKLEHLCQKFINDAQVVDAQALHCMKLTVQDTLQQMCNLEIIQNSQILDVTRPGGLPTLDIVIQPAHTAEYMVVNLVINP